MDLQMYRALRHAWAVVLKRRAVDKKGLAVALIFLVAISVWSAWSRDQTPEQLITWREEPDLSAHIDIRSGANSPIEEKTASSVSSLTGLKGELDDPRQGQ